MPDASPEAQLISMLLNRLERISADSTWAHRASGIRGSLLRMLGEIEEGISPNVHMMKSSLQSAFHILREAAKELR